MAEALFTVIDGTLVNLAKVTHIAPSTMQQGQVLVHFENKNNVVLNGTVETVLMKIGGNRSDMEKKPRTPSEAR